MKKFIASILIIIILLIPIILFALRNTLEYIVKFIDWACVNRTWCGVLIKCAEKVQKYFNVNIF